MKMLSTAPFLFGSCAIAAIGLTLAVPQTLRAQTAATQTTAMQTAGSVSAGHDAFTQHCSICHGAVAQGFIGPRIAGINFGSVGLKTIVRQGLGGYGGMPSISPDAVSNRNIDDIAAYLVSLGPPPAVAVAPAAGAASPAAAAPDGAASTKLASSGAAGGEITHGGTLFAANCSSCHGAAGQGGFGPVLKNEKSRKDFVATAAWIKNPAPPMPKLYPAPLSENDVHDVAAFVQTL